MEKDYFQTLENPFLLDIEDKKEYTNEELNDIQNMLQEKYIDYIIEDGYNENFKWGFSHVKSRCTQGLKQTIIDLSNNILPTKRLFKVGDGGDGKNCIVCSTPLKNNRCDFSQSIIQSLEEVGFNGHFYLLNGGFPTPLGIEMKYAGVPYSFKIFTMLEAYNLGFDKVIWIDASCYAVNNPQRLFDILNNNDTLFKWFLPNVFETDPNVESYDLTVLPKTLDLLNKIAGRNVRKDFNVNSIVFGLNLTSEKIRGFISEYYGMVNLGLPFLSTFPEEVVFSTIFNKPDYNYVFYYNNINEIDKLYINQYYADKDTAKNAGFYFVQRYY
jgi:hypothetical protein